MNWFVNVVLCFPRYTLIAGITVLALVHFSPQLKAMGPNPDFEMILPYIIKNTLPVGLVGLLLAGLFAAFMSNYAATINAAPAYVVNDIYKRFINPHAEEKVYVRLSILTTIAFVIVGFGFGFLVSSINDITLWIVSALWGGYTASNVLKWYWWRLNGHGYFWGMITGIGASLILPRAFPSIPALMSFPYIFVVSLIGCIIGSLLSEPDDEIVLMRFYMQVHPWGFWKPVFTKVKKFYPDFEPNKNFAADTCNVIVGVIWQTSLVTVPIALITQQYTIFTIALCLMLTMAVILKFTWWNQLDNRSEETLPLDFEQRVHSPVQPNQ
jgi:Na+/proline symporter